MATYSYNQESPTDQQMEDLYTWLTINERIRTLAGGGGSGYIGNPDTFNKKMAGYGVPVSNEEETRTQNVNHYSSSAITNYAKLGNGYVKIKYLGPAPTTPTSNLFNPNFYTDGRDMVRFDGTTKAHFTYNTSSSVEHRTCYKGQMRPLDMWESGTEGDYGYTISGGVLTLPENSGYTFVWIYPYNDSQSVIPTNARVTFNVDVMKNSSYAPAVRMDIRHSHNNEYDFDTYHDTADIPDWILDLVNGNYNPSIIYEDSNSVDIDWAGEYDGVEWAADTWYNFKLIYTIKSGVVTQIDYFVNNIHKLSSRIYYMDGQQVSGESDPLNLPFFDISGQSIPYAYIMMQISDCNIKNLGISYEAYSGTDYPGFPE